MKKSFITRILLDLIILVAVLNGWWFVAVPLIVAAVWKYSSFVEAIVAGIAYDSLFGFISGEGILGYTGTVLSLVIFIGGMLLRKIVRR